MDAVMVLSEAEKDPDEVVKDLCDQIPWERLESGTLKPQWFVLQEHAVGTSTYIPSISNPVSSVFERREQLNMIDVPTTDFGVDDIFMEGTDNDDAVGVKCVDAPSQEQAMSTSSTSTVEGSPTLPSISTTDDIHMSDLADLNSLRGRPDESHNNASPPPAIEQPVDLNPPVAAEHSVRLLRSRPPVVKPIQPASAYVKTIPTKRKRPFQSGAQAGVQEVTKMVKNTDEERHKAGLSALTMRASSILAGSLSSHPIDVDSFEITLPLNARQYVSSSSCSFPHVLMIEPRDRIIYRLFD